MSATTFLAEKPETKSGVNSQPDTLKMAAFHWKQGEDNRFEFAVIASQIVGNYDEGATVELAKRIKRSVTLVQNYAKAGQLWNAMLRAYPSQSEIMREELPISFWVPIARQWANGEMTIDGVQSWFTLCMKEGWTVEKFRSQLPTSEGRSEMVKSVKQFTAWVDRGMAFIENDLIHAPAFDVNPLFYSQFVRVLKIAKRLAEKVIVK